MKRVLLCCLALMLLLTVCVYADEDKLTLDRAIQISDTQIVLEFSAPIAINLERSNRGPYTALRLVEGESTLQWEGGQPLQATGNMVFLDEKHDRVLWTITEQLFGCTNATEVISFANGLEVYKDKGWTVKFCMEEVPYQEDKDTGDGLLCNVTTADGSLHLTANRPEGWDGMYVPIEKDFEYPADLSKTESVIPEKKDDFKFTLLAYDAPEPEPEEKTEPVEKDSKTGAVIGGCAGGAVVIAAIIFLAVKKGGKKK